MDETDIAIIGAGPHGLAAAAHLRRAGVECRVLGEPMSFWRRCRRACCCARTGRRPASRSTTVRCRSTATVRQPTSRCTSRSRSRTSSTTATGWRTGRTRRRSPPGHAGGPRGGRFVLSFDDGEPLRARRVVVAAGSPISRAVLRSARPCRRVWSLTPRITGPQRLESSRVLVVGGGQSALESAALLHEAGAEVRSRCAHHVNWLHGGKYHRMLGRMAPLVYAPTDVGPMGLSRVVAVPELFRRLPRSGAGSDGVRARSARRAPPGCSRGCETVRFTSAGPCGRCTREQLPGVGHLRHGADPERRPRPVRHRLPGRHHPVPVPRTGPARGRSAASTATRCCGRAWSPRCPGLHFSGRPRRGASGRSCGSSPAAGSVPSR